MSGPHLADGDLETAMAWEPFAGDRGPRDLRVLRDSLVVARCDHACHECGGAITTGTKHRQRVEASEDGLGSFRWCHVCMLAHGRAVLGISG